MGRIQEKAENLDRLFFRFREQQTEIGGEVTPEDKAELRRRLKELENELNEYLAAEYGVDSGKKRAYEAWLTSHKPFHWFIEFYGIMSQGGFDVVIGNPPYVKYASVRNEYTLRGYKTLSCGNLYAYFMERTLSLNRYGGRLGMIVPVSSVSGQAYAPLTRLFLDRCCWVSSYSNRPAKLFAGVEQRLTIFLTWNQRKGEVLSSPYQHWFEAEREDLWERRERRFLLFQRLCYVSASIWPHPHLPVKSGSAIAEAVFARLSCAKERLGLLSTNGSYATWVHDGPTYWIRALPFQPNAGRASERSNHYRSISVASASLANLVAAVVSSSTFYFFFKLISNCRDLGYKEWSQFPFGACTQKQAKLLAELGAQLGKRLKATAGVRQRRYASGLVEYEEYYPSRAKHIIDQIDQVLAKHYGFTDEELDFIINYDIKYRMGREVYGKGEG